MLSECIFLSIGRINYEQNYQDRVTLDTDTMSKACYLMLRSPKYENSDIFTVSDTESQYTSEECKKLKRIRKLP